MRTLRHRTKTSRLRKQATLQPKQATLKYHRSKVAGHSRRMWGFSFKSADGQTLVRSALIFESRAKAERSFISMIKSIAANQYIIDTSESGSAALAKN